ncbi:MAG: iron-containing alcohol dehydrogenase [Chloroflexota bacterium]
MRKINLLQPQKISFGLGCASECVDDVRARGLRRVFILTISPLVELLGPLVVALKEGGCAVHLDTSITMEPTMAMFEQVLEAARSFEPDAVLGLGGGSSMDTAKLVAALHNSPQRVRETFGINQLAGRSTFLACLPTTSGTGSEVSPNAILLDEAEQLKKGIVSPHLVPDAAYVDPALTFTAPPHITAATGVDALTHCIEAYANRFAHPIIDLYALEGIRLIAANVVRAVENGHDIEARTALSLGSLFGGLCLGPVNTGAVHALAYPLGGEFHVAHGVSNSVLLPHVLAFNLPAAPQRYAQVALALGVEAGDTSEQTAQRGLAKLRRLSAQCGIPAGLSDLDVPEDAIPRMAESAMKVTRLLKNNVRELTAADAEAIYRAAY